MAKKIKKEESGDTLFGSDDQFYLDPYGQLTIKGTDSPIGLECQEIIKANMAVIAAQTELDQRLEKFMKTMQERGLTKVCVLGKTIIYKEPKLSDPKVVVRDNNQE